jgi:hypothetical protein
MIPLKVPDTFDRLRSGFRPAESIATAFFPLERLPRAEATGAGQSDRGD